MTETNEKANQQADAKYEILISGVPATAPILRGNNLDELLKEAKLMYPFGTFIIKSLSKN